MFPLVALHALFRYKGVLVSLTSLHAEIPFGRGVLGHIAATGRRHVDYGSAGDDDIVTLLGDTALPHICTETCPHLFCWLVVVQLLLQASVPYCQFCMRTACGWPCAADADAASLLGHAVTFLMGGMAIRQRHSLVIATLRVLLAAVQRGLWLVPSCAQLVPILVSRTLVLSIMG